MWTEYNQQVDITEMSFEGYDMATGIWYHMSSKSKKSITWQLVDHFDYPGRWNESYSSEC